MELVNMMNDPVISDQTSEKKSFLWRIANFAEMQKADTVLKAQNCTFEIGTKIGIPSKWKCYLSVDSREEQKSIGIFAQLLEYPQDMTQLQAHVRCQIFNRSHHRPGCSEPYYLNSSFNRDMLILKHGVGWGFPTAMPQDPTDYPLPLAEDGSLEIIITVTVFNLGEPNLQYDSVMSKHKKRFLDRLHSDLKAKKDPTDITDTATKFVSKDGVEFPVKRVTLANRSPVFLSMFQAKMKEDETGVVKVDDINAKSLEVLLEYCHTGLLKPNWLNPGVIEGLVYGADKYMLDELKEFLDEVVGLVCTAKNCGTLLHLARQLEMKRAEVSLMEFFKRDMLHNADSVLRFAEDVKKGYGINSTQQSREDSPQDFKAG